MEDRKFTIYQRKHTYLGGKVEDGCLSLESDVYGPEYDSEKMYSFSKEETEKLFSVITLEDFIKLCRKKNVSGMEDFLEQNDIHYQSMAF
ncbi:MAG: hypothetical protein SOV71_03815 [Anaerovoracaceae bacterium]|nr:hypothetical protein [Bacillota bacterium]MDY2670665.1 hypothetical protein [Anaerovoracaceae bacterium]